MSRATPNSKVPARSTSPVVLPMHSGARSMSRSRKTAGTINILGAVGDGFNVNQYIQMNGGTVNISGVGDDGIQVSFKTDDDDVVEEDAENTGK